MGIAKVGTVDPWSCRHDNETDHYATGICGTPYCGGWSEFHCRDCGYFVVTCPCGCSNGFSGWSTRRYTSHHDRKRG